MRVARSTSARLSPRCGTRIRTRRPARSTATPPAPRGPRRSTGRSISGGGDASLVELRERRRQRRRLVAASAPARLVGDQLHALDDPAAAHREDLDRRRRSGPSFRPNTSRSPSWAVAIFCWRSRSVCDGAHRVAQLRRLLEALGVRPRRPSGRAASRPAPRCALRAAAACRRPRPAYSPPRADLADARRDAALDVVLEARPRRACR